MTQHYCPCDSCKEKNGGQPRLVNTQTLRNHQKKQTLLNKKIKELEKSLKKRYARVNSIESSNESKSE